MVLRRARTRIGRAQNAYFTTGEGIGSMQPTGLVTAAAVGKAGSTGQTMTVFHGDLVDLMDSVDAVHHGGAVKDPSNGDPVPGWMMSQTTRKVIAKLADTNGRPLYVPATANERPMLLDFPIYLNNDMPLTGANAKTIAFGNLGSYMIRDALDVTLYRFDDSLFSTWGQVGFLGVARAGGNLLDAGAVKLYQHSAT
jgi:HK97 family phage major capsid protein